MIYDIVIVGGGPAGVAAGVYAARKKMKTAVVAEAFGGQSLVSADIQNWIGTKNVSGIQLAGMLEDHLRAQEGVDILSGDLVTSVKKSATGSADKSGFGFAVGTKDGKNLETKTVLVCSGSRRRRLGVPGEDKYDGKGVAFCSTCDAPLFKDKAVAVVGGGNAGLEAVVDLLPYASRIYLMEKTEALRGDVVTQERVKREPKVQIMMGVETQEVYGNDFMAGLKYKDLKTGEAKDLPAEGLFVEIGSVPNNEFVKGLVETNKFGEIVVDPRHMATSAPGIWAVGDVSDVPYKQNNIAAGDAIKAVLNIYDKLQKGE